MKLATFTFRNSKPLIGVVDVLNNCIIDLQKFCVVKNNKSMSCFDNMLLLMESGQQGLDLAKSIEQKALIEPSDEYIYPLSEVRLLAPLPRPVSIRCFSIYEGHIKNSIRQILKWKLGWFGIFLFDILKIPRMPKIFYKRPFFYKGSSTSVIGHEDYIQNPSYSEKLDYELELGFYIGKKGSNIPLSEAMNHVFGYTCYNDVSARDALFTDFSTRTGPSKGKDFNTGNIMGPWIVTRDEIGDIKKLNMQIRVNGQLKGNDLAGSMQYSIEELVQFASYEETLYPGEFIGCGATTNGTGIETWTFLEHNDVVELEIENIGILRNTVKKDKLNLNKARKNGLIAI